MWGTPHGYTNGDYVVRFIPTDVGNTKTVKHGLSSMSVHPHGCGEHGLLMLQRALLSGSSPRMWGTRYIEDYGFKDIRFIPTDVGNTLILTYC